MTFTASLRCAAALVSRGTLVTVLLAACASTPRRQPLRPLAQIELQAPLAPADPALLAYLRVRDPVALLRSLSLEEPASPATGGAGVRTTTDGVLAKLQGLPYQDLRAGGVVSLFAYDPSGKSLRETPLFGLFPMAPTAQLAQQLQAKVGQVMALDGATLACLNRAAQLNPVSLRDLSRLANQPVLEDAQLFVNLELLRRYRSAAEAWFDSILPSRAPAGRRGQGYELLPASVSALPPKTGRADGGFARRSVANLFDLLEGLQSLAVGFSLQEKNIAVSVLSEARVAGPPRETTDLLGFLDEGDVAARFDAGADSRNAKLYYRQFYGSLFRAEPWIRARVEQMLADQEFAFAGAHGAVSLSFGDYGVRGVFLSQLKADADGLKATRKVMTFAEELRNERRTAREPGIKVERAIRKRRGFEIDRYEFPTSVDPAAARATDSSLRFTIEFAQAGPYFIHAINEPATEMDRLIDALAEGRPARAVAPAPAGTFLSGQINAVRILNKLSRWGPAHARGTLDERLPPLTFDSVESGRLTRFRLQIPRALVEELRRLGATRPAPR